MGNLAFMMKLYNWWNRFVSILKGEVAPDPSTIGPYDIQIALLAKGYWLILTGEMDNQTREALKKFQKDSGLEVDGLFGAQTWAKLKEK